jgi:cytoskeletal protein RodZ
MENKKKSKSLFERLKELRIKKGVQIETIADSSRIQLKYLQSLEDGDLLSIPEVYDKLFFRSYLKSLGVEDEEAYFDEFLQIRSKIRLDKTTTTIEISKPKDGHRKILSHPNLFVVLPVVLIFIVLAILLMNTEMIVTSSEGKVQEIDIKNVVQRIEAQEQAKLDSEKTAEEAKLDSAHQVNIESGQLSLMIRAKHRTWFRMISDRSDTSEYLLSPGQSITKVANRTFEFLIGRADGLFFSLNGNALSAPGTDSTVVRYMRIDSTGISAKILKVENSDGESNASL